LSHSIFFTASAQKRDLHIVRLPIREWNPGLTYSTDALLFDPAAPYKTTNGVGHSLAFAPIYLFLRERDVLILTHRAAMIWVLTVQYAKIPATIT
jgi:hypothetical protein